METRTETHKTDTGFVQVGVIVHEGREFKSGGAVVSDDHLVCYPKGNRAQGWDGADLGSYRVISTRPAVFFGYHSWMADRYVYAHVTLNDGRRYSVRGFGEGTLMRGRRLKG